MQSLQPVSVTRLYRMIAAQIGGKIQAGHFLPGSRLPSERDLAEQLKVSRTSVREALIALELEGLVEVRVGAGVFVCSPAAPSALESTEPTVREWLRSQGDIGPFDLIKVQLLVEPECAAMAAASASDEAIARIVAAGRAMEGSATPREHNRAFHIAIAAATNNAAMAMTVTNLWNLHDESPMFQKLEQHFVNNPESWAKAEHEHEELMQALVHRRPDDARLAMQAHFMGSQFRLSKAFPLEGAIPAL
ncbi:FadR/GntR family transcriptional regulator [Xylophilus sp. GOD-11R]|uniref:FadR/GntR family transcriptional regulator n=1 Tax=Xylophilus sp. GOD-11R TaxID=3089814 RepID=UPI00298BDE8B|nr:GntR family transcriptional regulator [Xylophilus sp. GOD-11R]WPB57319.1 GntR family transcriptional regulator [Xylophilus sp. GOD-11R]